MRESIKEQGKKLYNKSNKELGKCSKDLGKNV